MSGFVVWVEFRLKPGTRASFRALIDANARTSVQAEAGCLRFDVVEPDGEPDRVLLYEIYTDRDAFQSHARSDHYLRFDRDSAALCLGKSVLTGTLVCEGGA